MSETPMSTREARNLLDGIIKRDQAARVMRDILDAAVRAEAELAGLRDASAKLRAAHEAEQAALARETEQERQTFEGQRRANAEVIGLQEATIHENNGTLAQQKAQIADQERQLREVSDRLSRRLAQEAMA